RSGRVGPALDRDLTDLDEGFGLTLRQRRTVVRGRSSREGRECLAQVLEAGLAEVTAQHSTVTDFCDGDTVVGLGLRTVGARTRPEVLGHHPQRLVIPPPREVQEL